MAQKTKVLMISDHQLSHSGVGTQANWLIRGLLATGRYTFRCFGGAQRHEKMDVIKVNDDFIIKPVVGMGDRSLLRMTLALDRPDVILLFTDPRFFIWAFEMEDEIHQLCPIAYNHLWDNPPWPEFNRVLYESTDLINCINWPTYEMVHQRFPDKTNYIPHAVPKDLYFPMPDADRLRVRESILGRDRLDHFVPLYVSRNARRKRPSDIIVGFKQFLDRLESVEGHRRATMVMHTDPYDPEGPNLHHVVDLLHMKDHVVFSRDRIRFDQMNALYNACDTVINCSINEGFGVPTLEMAMTGRPVIAVATGGLTRQVKDHITGEEVGVLIEPSVKTLVGNQLVPYIYEDFVSHDQIADALDRMNSLGPAGRTALGARAREHALRDYDLDRLVADWDRTLTDLVSSWRSARDKRWAAREVL